MMFRLCKPVLLQRKVNSSFNFFSCNLCYGGRQVNSRIEKKEISSVCNNLRKTHSKMFEASSDPEMMSYANYS